MPAEAVPDFEKQPNTVTNARENGCRAAARFRHRYVTPSSPWLLFSVKLNAELNSEAY